MKKFSLLSQFEKNLKTLDEIYDSIKITLGPTGKNGISSSKNGELKFITNGSILLKSLEFQDFSSNVLLKLLEQASIKTFQTSGDGSTTTALLSCTLLKTSIKYIINGYNPIFLSNGLKKLAYFLMQKVLDYSTPIENQKHLEGILTTALGKKVNTNLLNCLHQSLNQIKRDGLILIEENVSNENEIEIMEGLQLDKGYCSSYFVNQLKTFEVLYDNPYILITSQPLESLNQIRDIIEYIKINNKSLVIVAEEISKEILSTLILNNIQKKLKIVVIRYTAIKFLKTGILEDLATLTYANYFMPTSKKNISPLTVEDLGQVSKVIITKEKSTFFFSKFSKAIAQRRINELNRELLTSESEDEKNLFKARIARLSGNITKIKIGLSNQYEIVEQRQKVENAMNTIRGGLEEGILPGGGTFFLTLREEIKKWSYLNLIGDEFYASNILLDALLKPFEELLENSNESSFFILEKISKENYPIRYDLLNQVFLNELEKGLIDSTKSIRSILWNSISIVSAIIISE
jgi:chaperonin GroEL